MKDYINSNNNRIQYIYTLLIIVYPIVGLYGTFVSGITAADFLLILFLPYFLFLLLKSDKPISSMISYPLIIFLLFIILQTVTILPIINELLIFDLIMSSLKYFLYILSLVVFTKSFFNIEYGFRILRFISIGTSLYLILQFFIYTCFGLYLPGTLPFLHMLSSAINNAYFLYNSGFEIRVCSVFAEPAHYSTYVTLYLAAELGRRKTRAVEYGGPIITSVALILSKSSTGIIMCLLVWFLWMVLSLIKTEEKFLKIIKIDTVLLLFPLILITLFQTDLFREFTERTYVNGHFGNSAIGRIGNVDIGGLLFDSTWIQTFIGHGLIELKDYLPGLARLLYHYGIIGCAVFALATVALFVKGNYMQRILIVVFLILNLGTEIVFGNFILLYFSFIIAPWGKTEEGVDKPSAKSNIQTI